MEAEARHIIGEVLTKYGANRLRRVGHAITVDLATRALWDSSCMTSACSITTTAAASTHVTLSQLTQ
ncbi:MAG: hypothetical protein AAF420_00175 [Pseudomonadota bacterium]